MLTWAPTAGGVTRSSLDDLTGVRGLLKLNVCPGPALPRPADQGRPVEPSPLPP